MKLEAKWQTGRDHGFAENGMSNEEIEPQLFQWELPQDELGSAFQLLGISVVRFAIMNGRVQFMLANCREDLTPLLYDLAHSHGFYLNIDNIVAGLYVAPGVLEPLPLSGQVDNYEGALALARDIEAYASP